MPARCTTLIAAAAAAMILGVSAFPAFAADNKQIAKRFEEAFAAGDKATLAEIVAANVADHNSPPGTRPGRQGLLDAVALFRAEFPDMTDDRTAGGRG